MTILKYNGEISDISADTIEFIDNVLTKKFGFENKKVRIEPVGKIGDNFASQVKRIIVEDDSEPFGMLLKSLPVIEDTAEAVFDVQLLFNNEILMYEILSKFKDFQTNAGIPKTDQFKFPQCYGFGINKDFILLEDLKISNFTMLDKFEPLSNDCVNIVLKKFAMFHGLSYVLKYQEPEKYKDLKEGLVDPFNSKEHFISQFQMTLELIEKDTINIVDQEKYKNVLKNSLSQMISYTAVLDKNAEMSQYSVITHGDCWTNNILFQIKEGKPVECILIDYQLSKHRSPAWDLLHMIFNCTNSASRHDYYLEWIDYYHSELDKSLSYFGLKSEIVYPRYELDADLKKYAKILFSHSVFATMMVMRKPEDSLILKEAMDEQDVDKFTEAMKASNLDEDSKKRTKNIIEGLIDTVLEFNLM
ncbi:uncharacterized protein LOC113513217 [Galleria mellonella]|uniref:Uncharacterized protein LOC113513217 n=1 Tax=Galleria mellonella TaxID=7137 RepID=A0A6J1WGB9_GALME|nr:uncharacterized protein LOC113513217 [Galleria mellonella]